MNRSTAINAAYRLHIEWISEREILQGKGFDLDRIHKVMLTDYRRRSSGVTQGYVRELRGQLILLGKIKKTLGHKVGQKYGGVA